MGLGSIGTVTDVMQADQLLHGGFGGKGGIESPATDPAVGNGDGIGVDMHVPEESHMTPPAGAKIHTGGLTSREDYSKSLPGNQAPTPHGVIKGTASPLSEGQEAGYKSEIGAAKPINSDQMDYQRSVVGEPAISSASPVGGTNPEKAFADSYSKPKGPSMARTDLEESK